MNLPEALCAQIVGPEHDPFFAPEREKPADRRAREAEAIAICLMCPSITACARLRAADPELRKYAVVAGLPSTHKPRSAPLCGSRAGYVAHVKNGDDPCEACTEASIQYHANRRREATSA